MLVAEVTAITAAAGFFALAYSAGPPSISDNAKMGMGLSAVPLGVAVAIATGLTMAKYANSAAKGAIIACALYDTVLPGLLIDIANGQ